MRYGDLPPGLRARCDGSHGVPSHLDGIEQAVQERKIERCRCHVRALCRRVSEGSSDMARDFLQTIVQFGGADILLSTLSLLPSEDETPSAAVLALLNDAMYICAFRLQFYPRARVSTAVCRARHMCPALCTSTVARTDQTRCVPSQCGSCLWQCPTLATTGHVDARTQGTAATRALPPRFLLALGRRSYSRSSPSWHTHLPMTVQSFWLKRF